mgnify:CR=1 FL=1
MESYAISKYRIRYVVPFEVELGNRTFEQVCSTIDGYIDYPYTFLGKTNKAFSGQWVRKSLRKGEQDVYDYIVDEFVYLDDIHPMTTIEKTGCFWSYSSFAKRPFEMEFTEGKYYDTSKVKISISIDDMGLYVFRSGVGFFWYEMQAEENAFRNSTELIKFQSVIKELNRSFSNHLWVKGDAFETAEEYSTEVIPFMLGNWIAERLQFLNVSFAAQRKNAYASLLGKIYHKKLKREERHAKLNSLYDLLPAMCPDKALMFSYVVFERDENWVKNKDSLRTAYYLTSGYKESYEMSDDIENVVKNPFSNVYWMAAREGCGYYAWQCEKNNQFFTNNQYSKIMNDYFLLYIRAIYQSYSLMRYAVSTSKVLPNDYHTYVDVNDETEKIAKKISDLSARISLFLVKSVVTSVSHIHHQNEFYDYLIERLQIKEDADSVTAGLAALNELQHETLLEKQNNQERIELVEREKEEQREKEADNRFQMGLGLMTFLAAISAVTDAYGIASGLATSQLSGGWQKLFYGLVVFCAGIFITSVIIFVQSAVNLKKNHKKNGRRKNK